MIAPAIFTIYRDANTGLFSICLLGGGHKHHSAGQYPHSREKKAEAAIKIWRNREKRRVGA